MESKELGTRTEVKNINSIRGVVNAIETEIERQISVLESGGVITNETRSYDGNLKTSISMRDKEVKQDYRFMPEPNLPPLKLTKMSFELPVLPGEKRKKLQTEFGLSLEIAFRLVDDSKLLKLFEEAQNCGKVESQNILSHLILLQAPKFENISAEFFFTASNMKSKNEITNQLIIKVFELSQEKGKTFQQILDETGWLKKFRNEKLIENLVEKVTEENPKIVKKFKKGGKKKDSCVNDLVGQVLDIEPILDPSIIKDKIVKKIS